MVGRRPPLFDMAEFEARLERVRAGMAERDLGLLLVHTAQNIYYLTGHYTFGAANYQCLILPARGVPRLLLRHLESGNARELSWLPDDAIGTFEDTEDPVAATVREVRAMGGEASTLGLEEDSFYTSARTAARLRAGLPDATVLDVGGLVERVRRVKSPSEVALVRHACELTALGMAAAIETIRPGATENEVAAAAFGSMVRAGSEYLTVDPIVSSGPRSGIPHMTFLRRVLEPGDTVLLEMAAVYERYVGPSMRSAVVGEPTTTVRRFADVCLEALRRGIEAVRPGATSGDVDVACRGFIERAGLYEHFRKRTGYSVGIGFPPGWVEGGVMSIKRDDQTVLEPGMVFHMPPALRMPREFGVGFSETFVVTPEGCEVMPSVARELAVR